MFLVIGAVRQAFRTSVVMLPSCATTQIGVGTLLNGSRLTWPHRSTLPTLHLHIQTMAPIVVGVVGASGSGKTHLAHALAARLEAMGKSSVVVSIDWFYHAPVPAIISCFCKGRTAWTQQLIERVRAHGTRRSSHVPSDFAKLSAADLIVALETQLSVDAGTYNWDEPGAVNLEDAARAVAMLREGKSTHVAAFNFETRQRDRHRKLHPADIVIVEGLFAYATSALEAATDIKLFVDASKTTTWARKLARDSHGRGGHGEAYLRTQFEQAWRMNVLHVAPIKKHKGVQVVRNDEDADWEGLVADVVGHVTSFVGDNDGPPPKRAKSEGARAAAPSCAGPSHGDTERIERRKRSR